jgi:hypothetical protein
MAKMPKDKEIHIKKYSVSNRVAAIVKAKQPFIDWTNGNPHAKGFVVTLDQVNEEPHLFLFPNLEMTEDNWKQVELAKPFIFEEMLVGRYRDEATWPQDRSAKVFDQWFDVEISSDITDFGDDTITKDKT